MDQILTSLAGFADRKDNKTVKALVAALLGVGAVLVTLVAFLLPGANDALEPVRVTIGGLAGLGWFVAGYLWWYALSSDSLHERLNVRANAALPVRRRRGLLFLLGWFALLAILANVGITFVAVVVGAMNVTVLLTTWMFLASTPEERLATEEAWEAQQQEDIWNAEQKKIAKQGGNVSMEILDDETAAEMERQGVPVQYMEFVEYDENDEPYTVLVPVQQIIQEPARKRGLLRRIISRI
jgi:hypothetical protein